MKSPEQGIAGLTAAIKSLDSIRFVELVMELKEKFDFDWTDEEMNAVQSTAGVIRLNLEKPMSGWVRKARAKRLGFPNREARQLYQ